MSKLITPGYAELNAQLHQSNPNYGTSSEKWVGTVRKLAGFLGNADILDYGCGKQCLTAGLPELHVRGYDPAIPGLDTAPEPADLVVCTDVLEHVEPELVDNVLDDLARVTRMLGFFTVATQPALKVLADGRNAHLTQQPIEWWLERLEKRFTVLGYHDLGGLEFMVLVASNATGYSLEPAPEDGWIHFGLKKGGQVSLRLPAALRDRAASTGPEAMLMRAKAYQQTGKFDDAEALLRKLISEYPDFPDALIELGQHLKEKNQSERKIVISPNYASLHAELHKNDPDYGSTGKRWAQVVQGLANRLHTDDILDYGCGKQTLAASLPELSIRGYDPALPELSAKPEPADLVVCTGVLEYVEPELVNNVLDDLARVIRKVGFLTVSTQAAPKTLADGRNAHLTQQPIAWWLAKLGQRLTIHEYRDFGGQEFYVLVSSTAIGELSLPRVEKLMAEGAVSPGLAPMITLSGLDLISDDSASERETIDGQLARLAENARINPNDAGARSAYGVALLQDKQLLVAIEELRAALALTPDSAELCNNLGLLLIETNQYTDAVPLLEQAIKLRPDYHIAWNNLAFVRLQLRDPEGAQEASERALTLMPDYAPARRNLATALIRQGKPDEGEELLQSALELNDDGFDAFTELAKLYEDQNELHKALACWEVIRTHQASDPRGWEGVGRISRLLERFDAATAILLEGHQRFPEVPTLRAELALALLDEGKEQDALALLGQLNREQPNNVAWLNLIAMAYMKLERHDLAEAFLLQGLILDPNVFDLHINLSYVHQKTKRHDLALQELETAFRLAPYHRLTRLALALELDRIGQSQAAIDLLRNILEDLPHDQLIRHALSQFELRVGDFANAWRNYQWRTVRFRYEGSPENWKGAEERFPDNLQDRWVVLRGEQGLGDELFFARFFPALAARGAKIAYIPRSDKITPLITKLPEVQAVITRDDLSAFDAEYAPIMSLAGDLPYALGFDVSGECPPAREVEPDAQLVELIQQQWMSQLSGRPRIGITWWAGTAAKKSRHVRDTLLEKEVPLDELLVALSGLQCDLVVLQRNPKLEDLELLTSWQGGEVFDASDCNNNLEEMLALLTQIDIVVGVSNTNMHLLAGLDKPAHVLVPMPGEFRWMNKGDTSPWFPSFRIYRQAPGHDWSKPLAELRESLFREFSARWGQE